MLSMYLESNGNAEARLQDTCGNCQQQMMLMPLRITSGSFCSTKMLPLNCRSWLFSPLSLLGNCLHPIHAASWAGSSSLCSLNSHLWLSLLQFWCFIRRFLLHLSILPSGVLIMYEHKIFVIYFTVSSPICLLHYFIHQQNYLPHPELWQYGFFVYFSLSFVIMQLMGLSPYFYRHNRSSCLD